MKKLVAPILALSLLGAASGHHWQSINHRNWRIVDLETAVVAVAPATERCAAGMVEAQGLMKQNDPKRGSVEDLQKTTCLHYKGPFNKDGSPKFPERCDEFDQPRWEAIASTLPTKSMDVCIDQFEYPNVPGQYPMIFVTYYEAQNACFAQHKRLCNEEEWTFACEGPDAMPYPYGYKRDATACNIDKTWRTFSEKKMWPRDGASAEVELDKLWQGEASGMRAGCKSPFGAYDLTGNVDEWTTTVRPRPYLSVLKGGYWGPVRNRCRPATTVHNEGHYFYQQGLRCCADPKH